MVPSSGVVKPICDSVVHVVFTPTQQVGLEIVKILFVVYDAHVAISLFVKLI